MMGMTGGKDKDGKDMKDMFNQKMEMKKGQSHEMPTREQMEEKMQKGGKDGGPMKNFAGGCGEKLCCGH